MTREIEGSLGLVVERYGSDKWSKKLTTKDQLGILVSANLAQSKSLSDISSMVEATGKFSFDGINKSSLSRVNSKRNSGIFEEAYRHILEKVRKRVPYSKIRVIDTTTSVVAKNLFSLWKMDGNRGAIKIGVEYDPFWQLPDQIIISDWKKGDTTHGKEFEYKKGLTYIFDRGFNDYGLYTKIIKTKAFFVARMHKTNRFSWFKQKHIKPSNVISDETGILGRVERARKSRVMQDIVRVIRYKRENGNKEGLFLATNRFDLRANEVRHLYKRRWDIELFFKFIKQNLKLKKFFGTTHNAVKSQIYCALIAYLLVYLIKPKYKNFTEFLRKVRYTLFFDFQQLSFITDT